MALTKARLIADGVITVDNLHESHGITTTHIGEGDKLFYTDTRVSNYLSANNYITTGDVPNLETVTSLSISANILSYVNEAGVTTDIDLSTYLDDTNLARLVSGTLNPGTGIATFTRDDLSTFTIDFSSFLADANDYVSSGEFSTSTGVLTLTRLGGGTITVDLNGKYAEAVHTHDDRYYTELESDGRFAPISHTHSYLPLAGGTITGNLDVDGIIDNTRNNTNAAPPSISDHTAGTRIKLWDSSDVFFYALGIENGHLWSNADTGFKWYQRAVEKMSLSNGNLTVAGTLSASGYNKSNWDTAYGWGNHAGLYSLLGHTHDDRYYTETESDGRFAPKSAYDVYGTGYGWLMNDYDGSSNKLRLYYDDGSKEFRLYSYHGVTGEAHIALYHGAGFVSFGGDNINNWNTAYGWGNHAGLYLPIGGKAADSNLLDGTDSIYFDHRRYTDSSNYLGGYYVSGGTEKPNNSVFGAGKFKVAMLSGGNLGFGGSWNDVMWISTYSGGDVKSSHALVFDKYSSNVWVSDQNFDSASWGTGYLLITSANIGSQSVNYATGAGNSTTTSQRSFNYLYATDYLETSGAVYGTVFYDNNDRGYYLNPNGFSNLHSATFNANWAGSSPHEGAVNIRGNYPSMMFRNFVSNTAWLRHMDGSGNIQHYYVPDGYDSANWSIKHTMQGDGTFYSASSMRSPIFYDSNDTGYYINPGEGSNLVQLTLNGAQFWKAANGGYQRADSRNEDTYYGRTHWYGVSNGGSTSNFRHAWYDGNEYFHVTAASSAVTFSRIAGTTSLVSTGDVRGTLFYDYNNTGYYVDPASTSVMATVSAGTLNGSDVYTTGGWFRNHTNSNGIYWSTTGWHLYPKNASDFYVRSGSSSASIQFIRGGSESNYIHNASDNAIGFLSTAGGWILRVDNGGSATAYGDMRAPIFYDHNNTGYYVDPHATSNLNTLQANTIRNDGSVSSDDGFGIYWESSASTAYAIYREGGAWSHPYPDLRIAFHTGIKLGANASYNGIRFYTDYDMSTQVMSVNNASDGYGAGHVHVNGIMHAGDSHRAPIFYDSNNTGYYVNPAGDVVIDKLTIGTGANSAKRLYVQETEYANGPMFMRASRTTDVGWNVAKFAAQKTTAANNGFGATISFHISDTIVTEQNLGELQFLRKNNSTSGQFAVTTTNTGAGYRRFYIEPAGYVYLGEGLGEGNHVIRRNASQGNVVLTVSAAGTSIEGTAGTTADTAEFFAVSGAGANAASAAMKVGRNSSTLRSINAAGTINASGADYAEYMTKAVADSINKGDVVGVNLNGELTNIYADSVSFVVKSTDPSYVGNDTWYKNCKLQVPTKPLNTNFKTGNVDENGVDIIDNEALEAAYKEYEVLLKKHMEELEAIRVNVDRIAFSGQVPCNVYNASVGDYIIPSADENGKVIGIAVTSPTFDEYRISVGRVWKIMEDGRAWIAVKIS